MLLRRRSTRLTTSQSADYVPVSPPVPQLHGILRRSSSVHSPSDGTARRQSDTGYYVLRPAYRHQEPMMITISSEREGGDGSKSDHVTSSTSLTPDVRPDLASAADSSALERHTRKNVVRFSSDVTSGSDHVTSKLGRSRTSRRTRPTAGRSSRQGGASRLLSTTTRSHSDAQLYANTRPVLARSRQRVFGRQALQNSEILSEHNLKAAAEVNEEHNRRSRVMVDVGGSWNNFLGRLVRRRTTSVTAANAVAAATSDVNDYYVNETEVDSQSKRHNRFESHSSKESKDLRWHHGGSSSNNGIIVTSGYRPINAPPRTALLPNVLQWNKAASESRSRASDSISSGTSTADLVSIYAAGYYGRPAVPYVGSSLTRPSRSSECVPTDDRQPEEQRKHGDYCDVTFPARRGLTNETDYDDDGDDTKTTFVNSRRPVAEFGQGTTTTSTTVSSELYYNVSDVVFGYGRPSRADLSPSNAPVSSFKRPSLSPTTPEFASGTCFDDSRFGNNASKVDNKTIEQSRFCDVTSLPIAGLHVGGGNFDRRHSETTVSVSGKVRQAATEYEVPVTNQPPVVLHSSSLSINISSPSLMLPGDGARSRPRRCYMITRGGPDYATPEGPRDVGGGGANSQHGPPFDMVLPSIGLQRKQQHQQQQVNGSKDKNDAVIASLCRLSCHDVIETRGRVTPTDASPRVGCGDGEYDNLLSLLPNRNMVATGDDSASTTSSHEYLQPVAAMVTTLPRIVVEPSDVDPTAVENCSRTSSESVPVLSQAVNKADMPATTSPRKVSNSDVILDMDSSSNAATIDNWRNYSLFCNDSIDGSTYGTPRSSSTELSGVPSLKNSDVNRIQMFYRSNKTEVFVCACAARLYRATCDLNTDILNEQYSRKWYRTTTVGVPVIVVDTGESRCRDRKLYVLLADVITGCSLWRDVIDHLSDYRSLSSSFHAMRESRDHNMLVGLLFGCGSDADDFYRKMYNCTSGPCGDRLLCLSNSGRERNEKNKNNDLQRQHSRMRRNKLKKSDISAPCCFEHVSKLERFPALLAVSAGVRKSQSDYFDKQA